ncbi:Toll/interleukin-1 receptor domain-containing protein [Tanacetum coccineum]
MKGLANMKELRYLYLNGPYDLQDEVSNWNLPNALRFLSWGSYPFSSLPKTVQANNLVGLVMVGGHMVQLRDKGAEKPLLKLRFLEFTCLEKLRTLDLSVAPNLETLNLQDCSYLVEVQFQVIPNLKELHITYCDRLEKLHMPPDSPKLETLSIKYCADMVELRMPTECPKLVTLDLLRLNLTTLHLGITPNLKTLSLQFCHALISLRIPKDIGRLDCLKELDITGTSCMRILPQCIFKMKGLRIDGSSKLVLESDANDVPHFFLNVINIWFSKHSARGFTLSPLVLVVIASGRIDVIFAMKNRKIHYRSDHLIVLIKLESRYFKGGRGLRQGDPISPYLFTLVMEVLNLLIKKNIEENEEFEYHHGCKKLKITHLCFADDLLAFCHGDCESVRIIKKSLDEFSGYSGLLPNMQKIGKLPVREGATYCFCPEFYATRDEQVLVAHRVGFINNVTLLSHTEAIRLFNRYAFTKEIPIQGHKELSRQVVEYADGLPLTIKVLGSLLCGQNEPEWKDALERLKTIPLKETMKILELSYDALDDDYKEIFLDVACILKGWRQDNAVIALESCGFHARNGLRVLQQRSLMNISHGGYLEMHDHIEEMSKNIVRRLNPNEPERHSRLWIDDEIKDIMANNMGPARSGILGEATVNIARYYSSSRSPATVSLPLKKCNYGTVLQGQDMPPTSLLGRIKIMLEVEINKTSSPDNTQIAEMGNDMHLLNKQIAEMGNDMHLLKTEFINMEKELKECRKNAVFYKRFVMVILVFVILYLMK